MTGAAAVATKFAHHHHCRSVSVGHTRVARYDIKTTSFVVCCCCGDDCVQTEITATTTTTTTKILFNNRTMVSTRAAAVLHGDRLWRCAYNWLVPGIAAAAAGPVRRLSLSARAARGFFGSTQFSPVHGGGPRFFFFPRRLVVFHPTPSHRNRLFPPCHDGSAWSVHGQVVVVVMNIVILGVFIHCRQSHTW